MAGHSHRFMLKRGGGHASVLSVDSLKHLIFGYVNCEESPAIPAAGMGLLPVAEEPGHLPPLHSEGHKRCRHATPQRRGELVDAKGRRPFGPVAELILFGGLPAGWWSLKGCGGLGAGAHGPSPRAFFGRIGQRRCMLSWSNDVGGP